MQPESNDVNRSSGPHPGAATLKDLNECPPSIALGFTETADNPFVLADSADRIGVKMYTDWPDSQNWTKAFQEAIDAKSGVQIYFNLDDVDDPVSLARSMKGCGSSGIGDYTAWGLAQIKASPPSVQARATWYRME